MGGRKNNVKLSFQKKNSHRNKWAIAGSLRYYGVPETSTPRSWTPRTLATTLSQPGKLHSNETCEITCEKLKASQKAAAATHLAYVTSQAQTHWAAVERMATTADLIDLWKLAISKGAHILIEGPANRRTFGRSRGSTGTLPLTTFSEPAPHKLLGITARPSPATGGLPLQPFSLQK